MRQPGPTNLKNVFRISWPGENPAKFLFLKLNPSIDYGKTDAGAFVFLAPCRRWKEPYSLPFCSGSLRLRLRFRSCTPGELEPGRANATDCAACFSVAMDRFSAVREQGDYNDDRNRY